MITHMTHAMRTNEGHRKNEEFYRTLVENLPNPVIVYSAEQLLYLNSAALHFMEYSASEIIGRSLLDLVDDADIFLVANSIELRQVDVNIDDFEITLLAKSGQQRRVLVRAAGIMYHDISAILAVLIDVTERRRIEDAEREQRTLADALRETSAALTSTLRLNEVFDLILTNVGRVVPHDAVNIMLLDEELRTAHIAHSRGYENREGAATVSALRVLIDDVPHLRQMVKTGRPLAIPDTRRDSEWQHLSWGDWIRSYAGAPMRFRKEMIGFLNLDSSISGFYNFDHTERLQAFADQAAIAIENARLFDQVHRLAVTDELTGLFNRRGLFQFGEREVSRALRFQRPLAAIMFDIDHFKHVNDLYGHPAGDQVLHALGQHCREHVRAVDILGRYGGEEFVLLLPETALETAIAIAERLRHAVEKMRVSIKSSSSEIILQITISMGVAALGSTTPKLSTLIKHADTALQRAKQSGRNRVEWTAD